MPDYYFTTSAHFKIALFATGDVRKIDRYKFNTVKKSPCCPHHNAATWIMREKKVYIQKWETQQIRSPLADKI